MILLDQYFNKYTEECEFVKRLRPATIRSSKEAYKHFRNIVPEVSTLNDVSAETITVFFKRLQMRERIVTKDLKKIGIKDSTVIFYAGRLKTFFKWLREHRHIEANPFDNIVLPKPIFVDRRALTGEQIKKIITAVIQNAQSAFLMKRDLAMISILTFCGLRRNELVALEVRDIDLLGGYITVRPESSKSKRLRKVPINTFLKIHLVEYLETRKKDGYKTQYLWVSNNADVGLTKHGVKHWVERISHLSGVKFHLHRFRHTFATNLAMQDVGVIKIQKLMGHTDIKMTQTYLRSVSTEDLAGDINKLSFDSLA